jgi:hypothetical protein
VFGRDRIVEAIRKDFVPAAVMVPRYGGGDPESRFVSWIRDQKPPPTSGRPVPQGVCITTAEGDVLEWSQLFRDEAAVLAFLERNRRPDGGPGATAPPRSHDRCPAGPRGARGSFAGRLYGRAVGTDGKVCADTELQDRYVQERIVVPRRLVEEFTQGLRPGEWVDAPEPFARALFREMYLGQKDVAPLDNPLGAKADVRALRVRAKEGALEAELHVVTDRSPNFRHELKLSGRGVVDADRLLLVMEGDYALRWRGFEAGDEERFRKLMAGRSFGRAGRVRFGVQLERKQDGPEQDDSEGPPASLGRVAGRLGPAIQRHAQSGGDMSWVQREMREFEKLLQERDFAGAQEKALGVLKKLGDE